MNLPVPAAASAGASEQGLGLLIDEMTAKLQAGERIDVEAYAAAHPEHAEALRQLLPALHLLADLGRSAVAGSAAGSAAVFPGDAITGTLGDFRILREVGRGGMGVVYEAEQISLGRRVALKVLPFAAALDARQLQRFQNEAQAAAHLQHTNIVPVYYVGCERGVHFYAMQYIDGQTVAALIAELRAKDESRSSDDERMTNPQSRMTQETPVGLRHSTLELFSSFGLRDSSFFRTVAHLGVQAAEALEHAHAEGIIHRDIKPANLLVEWRAEGVHPLRLWVTDFGLARGRGEAGLTLSGDLLGTLRYMSPEQALGQRQRVDHRADLYSLGATLYELLTLEPVHAGRDRQELLRQIDREPPQPLRRLNPAIPADLETVVLKALDMEPEGRYATAQELADDLRRFLEDKPIRAKRPTPVQRARKWARRHKPVVAAGVAVLLLGMVAWAVSTVLIVRQRNEARAQRALAQEQRELARRAVDEMYTEVAEQWLAYQPRMEDVQRRFLLKALHYYEAFAQEPGTGPALRHQAGIAARRVGDIQFRLGQHTAAEAAYQQAITLQAELTAAFPAAPEYQRELAASRNNLGALLMELGRPAEAEKALRRALLGREQLVADFPTEPGYRADLAESHYTLGALLDRTGQAAEAEHAFRQANVLLEKLTAEGPAPATYRRQLANTYNALAKLFLIHRRLPDAEQALRRAVEMQEQLATEFPAVPKYRHSLAGTRNNLALILSDRGRLEEAEQILHQALAVQERLAVEFPRVADYQLELARSHNQLGNLWFYTGRHREAEAALRQALAVQERLAAESPGVTVYRLQLAQTHHNLGNVLTETGRPREAEAAYRQATVLFEKLVAEPPRMPECAEGLTQSRRKLGDLLWEIGRRDQAGQAYAQARAGLEKRVADNPGAPTPALDFAWFLADCPDPRCRDVARAAALARQVIDRTPQDGVAWQILGVAQYRTGEWQEALKALHKAVELRGSGSSVEWFYLAMAYAQLGEKDRARQWYERACDAMGQNQPGMHWLRHRRAEAAALLGLTPADP